jgi:hypothetical protein
MAKSSRQRKKQRRRQPPPAASERARRAQSSARSPHPAARRPRRGADQPPPAPWGSFPLVELATLIALVMLIAGFFFVGGERGGLMIIAGLVIGSLAGLELAVREHFAGYRSHTLLLAGVPAVTTMGVLFYAGPDSLGSLARIAIAAAVFAAAALGLVSVFRGRSGGYSMKMR